MYQVERPPVERGRLSPGHRGTAETLAIMRRLAREGASMPNVRHAARRILQLAGIPGHDFVGELAALHSFVSNRVRFVRDPMGVEQLQSPRYTLEHMSGDCDDKAILLSSLALAIGHPAELFYRVIGTNPLRGLFSHVYVVARLGARRFALDPTHAGTPFGWEHPRPAIMGEVRV